MKGSGFGGSGFRGIDIGFRGIGLGLKVEGLGCGVVGLGIFHRNVKSNAQASGK